jgi:dTMP kinase
MLIDICGIDGCGKSTQAMLLKKCIEENSPKKCIVVHAFRPRRCSHELLEYANKCGTDYYSMPGNLRTLSFLMDALINMVDVIVPELNKGKIVILEKYYIDTLIYGPLMGANEDSIKRICQMFPRPDLTFLLNISPKTAVERVLFREKNEHKEIVLKENYELAFKAAKRYTDYYNQTKGKRSIYLLDGEGEIEEINNLIANICETFCLKHDPIVKI